MASPSYCSVEDVYRYAVPAAALVRRLVKVEAVDTSSDTITAPGHGLALNDPLEVATLDGGSLAGGLSAATVYFAAPVADSDDLLKVSATKGGGAVDLTSAGSEFYLAPSVRPTVQAGIDAASRWIDARLPAHAAPLEASGDGTFPDVVRQMAAVLAAECTLVVLGLANDKIAAAADRMRADAKLLLAGLPLRDVKVATHSNLSAYGSAGSDRSGAIP